MRSLTLKLTLAFLLVGLTGAALVALVIRERTRSAFDTFLLNRDQQTLVENLLEYYQAAGSWQGRGGELGRLPQAPRRRPLLTGKVFAAIGSAILW